MSGIGQLMPWTRWAFLAGALALVGVPPFAGFFSKDAIIAATLHDHWYGVVFWVVALIGAFLTGLYTFRMYFIVFPGDAGAVRARAGLRPRGSRRGARARCSLPVGDPRRARRDRRLDPVLAALASRHELARAGRRDARRRRADELAGGSLLGARASRSGWPGSASRTRSTAVSACPCPACRRCSAPSSTSSTSTRPTTRSSPSRLRRFAASLRRDFEEPVDPRREHRRRRRRARARPRRPPPPDRAAAHVRLLPRRGHGGRRRRLPGRAMTSLAFSSLPWGTMFPHEPPLRSWQEPPGSPA